MDEKATLASLKVGQRATIKKVMSTGAMGRRLRDLGMIEGTCVECLQKSPAGDPVAYLVRGAAIALRNSDAGQISVEKVTR